MQVIEQNERLRNDSSSLFLSKNQSFKPKINQLRGQKCLTEMDEASNNVAMQLNRSKYFQNTFQQPNHHLPDYVKKSQHLQRFDFNNNRSQSSQPRKHFNYNNCLIFNPDNQNQMTRDKKSVQVVKNIFEKRERIRSESAKKQIINKKLLANQSNHRIQTSVQRMSKTANGFHSVNQQNLVNLNGISYFQYNTNEDDAEQDEINMIDPIYKDEEINNTQSEFLQSDQKQKRFMSNQMKRYLLNKRPLALNQIQYPMDEQMSQDIQVGGGGGGALSSKGFNNVILQNQSIKKITKNLVKSKSDLEQNQGKSENGNKQKTSSQKIKTQNSQLGLEQSDYEQYYHQNNNERSQQLDGEIMYDQEDDKFLTEDLSINSCNYPPPKGIIFQNNKQGIHNRVYTETSVNNLYTSGEQQNQKNINYYNAIPLKNQEILDENVLQQLINIKLGQLKNCSFNVKKSNEYQQQNDENNQSKEIKFDKLNISKIDWGSLINKEKPIHSNVELQKNQKKILRNMNNQKFKYVRNATNIAYQSFLEQACQRSNNNISINQSFTGNNNTQDNIELTVQQKAINLSAMLATRDQNLTPNKSQDGSRPRTANIGIPQRDNLQQQEQYRNRITEDDQSSINRSYLFQSNQQNFIQQDENRITNTQNTKTIGGGQEKIVQSNRQLKNYHSYKQRPKSQNINEKYSDLINSFGIRGKIQYSTLNKGIRLNTFD